MTDTQMITYNPWTGESSRAKFTIVPSLGAIGTLSEVTNKGGSVGQRWRNFWRGRSSSGIGAGVLTFTVEHNGNILSRINVPAFFEGIEPAGKYPKPSYIEFSETDLVNTDLANPDLVNRVKSPHIIIKVENANKRELSIKINPRDPALAEKFLIKFNSPEGEKEYGEKKYSGSGRDMEWEFVSGITDHQLRSLAQEIYDAFVILMRENPDLSKYQNKLLEVLKTKGKYFYTRVFNTDRAEPALRGAMDLIENHDTQETLRIQIRTTDIYAPWQILYPNSSTVKKPEFWGFRYALSCLPDIFKSFGNHNGPDRQPSYIIKYNSPEEIVFAGYWQREDETVSDNSRELESKLKQKFGNVIEGHYTLISFMQKLKASLGKENIKLLFAYGHATTGTSAARRLVEKEILDEYILTWIMPQKKVDNSITI